VRKAVRPLVLFVCVSAAAFVVATLHVFKPGTPKAAAGTGVTLGDVYRGETVFQQSCASCHGAGGTGGGIGPKLAGALLTPAGVKAQIDNGGGAMPAGVVRGSDEADVLAYVVSIAAQ
jgi:mono/diheme cytochrome c family protein